MNKLRVQDGYEAYVKNFPTLFAGDEGFEVVEEGQRLEGGEVVYVET